LLAHGTSGSWVVAGQTLYGMVIAVSTTERYVLMMTAERLFSNIKESDPSVFNISLCPTPSGVDPLQPASSMSSSGQGGIWGGQDSESAADYQEYLYEFEGPEFIEITTPEDRFKLGVLSVMCLLFNSMIGQSHIWSLRHEQN
jgi:hypothetical protein